MKMQNQSPVLKLALIGLTACLFVTAIGCGGSSGPVEIKTDCPPVTEEEQKVVNENMESLKDEH